MSGLSKVKAEGGGAKVMSAFDGVRLVGRGVQVQQQVPRRLQPMTTTFSRHNRSGQRITAGKTPIHEVA